MTVASLQYRALGVWRSLGRRRRYAKYNSLELRVIVSDPLCPGRCVASGRVAASQPPLPLDMGCIARIRRRGAAAPRTPPPGSRDGRRSAISRLAWGPSLKTELRQDAERREAEHAHLRESFPAKADLRWAWGPSLEFSFNALTARHQRRRCIAESLYRGHRRVYR